MDTPTRKPLSKTDIARIYRDCYGSSRFGESDLRFAKAVERAVRADLEAENKALTNNHTPLNINQHGGQRRCDALDYTIADEHLLPN